MATVRIAANTVVEGPIAIARGNLDIYGTVEGDVVALDGNVRVHEGGRVVGDAWAAGGSVIIEGGVVEGQKRSLAIDAAVAVHAAPAAQSVAIREARHRLVCAAHDHRARRDGIRRRESRRRRHRARARILALVLDRLTGQVAALPALLVLVVALAITVLGTLLIPFAIVAYVIAAAGLVTLGFLAVARLAGGVITSGRGTTSRRGANLRALISGLAIFLGIWMVAALFAWNPVAGAILRAIGIALTWVAATVGLGAALSSRAGTQRPGAGSKHSAPTDEFAWQTPTPVRASPPHRRRTASSPTR